MKEGRNKGRKEGRKEGRKRPSVNGWKTNTSRDPELSYQVSKHDQIVYIYFND